jgi:shikimate kinase
MMGSGKSSVGRRVAELTGRPFLDTDLLLQSKLGRSIPQIFALYGEDAFRAHETGILKSLEPDRNVLATGGGIVVREENWTHLRRLGVTIYLKGSLSTLVGRLESSKKKRPLLDDEQWEKRLEQLLAQRMPYYERADLIISVDTTSIDEAADQIRQAMEPC